MARHVSVTTNATRISVQHSSNSNHGKHKQASVPTVSKAKASADQPSTATQAVVNSIVILLMASASSESVHQDQAAQRDSQVGPKLQTMATLDATTVPHWFPRVKLYM